MPRFWLAVAATFAVAFSSSIVVSPALAATATASSLPGLLAVRVEDQTHDYDHDRFQHWIDADFDGCNTRYEVLITESSTSVTVGSGCSLTGGTWVSKLDGVTATSPAAIEIDHHVALAEAWRSGAWGWSDAVRRDFANDLGVPYALNATSLVSNQAKGDKDPAEWLPSNVDYQCEYVTSWALMKYRWSLTVDAAELSAIQSTLTGACGDTVVTLPTVMAVVTPEPAPGTTTITPFPTGLTRLQGADRYETAVVTSQRYDAGVPVAFVATGTNFPDALSAAAAAANLGGPLLLTTPTGLPSAVATELDRLNPQQIYVIGGSSAVSDAVVSQISEFGPVQRIGGADRYATSLNITTQAFTASSTVVIATAGNFPDALAATGLAGSKGAPVILVNGGASSLPAATRNLITSLGATTIYIAGGTNAVSTGIAAQLAGPGRTVTRYAGSDRYDTAAKINSANFAGGSGSTAFLATGENFPDALAGAALAGRLQSPLFITLKGCSPTPIYDARNALSAGRWVVLGGTSAVSNNAANNNECVAAPPPPPPPPGPPSNPGDTKNCSDFANWSQAQSWFNTYYPAYGDIARLDQDSDLIACESLAGAP